MKELREADYRVIAATIGVSGWALSLLLWSVIRMTGTLELRFSAVRVVHWFESWIEPVLLFGALGLSAWLVVSLYRDARR